MDLLIFQHFQRRLDRLETAAGCEQLLEELKQHDREDPDVSAIAEQLAMVRRLPPHIVQRA